MYPSTDEYSTDGSGVQDKGPQISGLVVQIMEVMPVVLARIRQKLLEMAIVICVILLVFWVALFLYGSFYYSFMPTANYITPVHFTYRTDCSTPHHAMCSFPVANVSLLKNGKHEVMTYSQPYQITLELEMPESPSNQQLGMFLVKMSLYSKTGQIIDVSARSAMLHYRSSLLKALDTLMFSPMLLSRVSEQKQSVMVELYSEFRDDSYKPTAGAVIEIHSQHIQIYRANLYIFAHFTGIRYLLYHFPLTSTLIGVMSNFAFLSLIIGLSYLQFCLGDRRSSGEEEIQEADFEFDMDQHDRKEREEFNDHSEPQHEGISKVITKSMLDSPITMGNKDTADSNSDEMEESIPDMGVDGSEHVEDEHICTLEEGEMILRQRNLSAMMFQTSQALTDTGDKNLNGIGACLSS
ncbi:BSCL2 lipid droplet biogenesis associated, seipin, like [Triplophysa dalaica]|uniref:BSCL2 lipid droplet biogenesis associated, seipin, like n=1 Tax=Triplophysa dalaica TaxID=1582913 RepID=UPI0024E01CF5|nr:BSCL2 lipid droplet biogenesis associated, seipin, like [Triplophysa dalaica]